MPPMDIHTNSKSLISMVMKLTTWNTHFSATMLQPEWDDLQAILTIFNQLPNCPQLSHIKSHQDDIDHYATLSLWAQLNIDADCLTDEHHHHIQDDLMLVPMIKGTTAQVTMLNGTITSKLQQTICKHIAKLIIKKYIREKYTWMHSQFTNIHWLAHHQSLCSLKMMNKFLTKFLYGWLPIGHLSTGMPHNTTSNVPPATIPSKIKSTSCGVLPRNSGKPNCLPP